MKRHLAPSLFALSLCALLGGARAAEAQGVDANVATTVDSVVIAVPSQEAAQAVPASPVAPADLSLIVSAAFPLTVPDVSFFSAPQGPTDVMAFQGRNWKMPTSRTLMIGGTALALVGIMAVKGDTGAIMAMTGGGVAVYGLYLHYNR